MDSFTQITRVHTNYKKKLSLPLRALKYTEGRIVISKWLQAAMT